MINHRDLENFDGDPSWIHNEILKAITLVETNQDTDITIREFVNGCAHLIFSLALTTGFNSRLGYEVGTDFKTMLTNFHDIQQHIIEHTTTHERILRG